MYIAVSFIFILYFVGSVGIGFLNIYLFVFLFIYSKHAIKRKGFIDTEKSKEKKKESKSKKV
jgi:phosphotransferase system  glucose/maltose/N-acetylglucosamine-specific IIC component